MRDGKTSLKKNRKSDTKKWHYTHKRLLKCLFFFKNNLPWLFTFQDFPELHIPNTTNSCDGSFAHWKSKVKLHRGLSKKKKKNDRLSSGNFLKPPSFFPLSPIISICLRNVSPALPTLFLMFSKASFFFSRPLFPFLFSSFSFSLMF